MSDPTVGQSAEAAPSPQEPLPSVEELQAWVDALFASAQKSGVSSEKTMTETCIINDALRRKQTLIELREQWLEAGPAVKALVESPGWFDWASDALFYGDDTPEHLPAGPFVVGGGTYKPINNLFGEPCFLCDATPCICGRTK